MSCQTFHHSGALGAGDRALHKDASLQFAKATCPTLWVMFHSNAQWMRIVPGRVSG